MSLAQVDLLKPFRGFYFLSCNYYVNDYLIGNKFSRSLNFTKTEEAYFERLKYRDLAGKLCQRELNDFAKKDEPHSLSKIFHYNNKIE